MELKAGSFQYDTLSKPFPKSPQSELAKSQPQASAPNAAAPQALGGNKGWQTKDASH